MKREQNQTSNVSQSIKKRTVFISAFFVLVCVGILVPRLGIIQIRDYEKYQVQATNQQLRDTKISANRGTIYDANMKVLAKSATVWTVFLSPKEIESKNKDDVTLYHLWQVCRIFHAAVTERKRQTGIVDLLLSAGMFLLS